MLRLGPGDYRAMPWRNGGGSTTELLIHPPGATVDGDFLWRISMAEVGTSGPFSPFPGMDRTLLLLSGDGMVLDHGPMGVQRLEEPFRPVTFSGDWTTRGTLLGGPCRDFNIMSARNRVRHHLQVISPGPAPARVPGAPLLVVVCLRGRAVVEGESLGERDLLVLEDLPEISVRAEVPNSHPVLARIVLGS